MTAQSNINGRFTSSSLQVIVALLLLSAPIGCGNSAAPKLAEVTGRVTYMGEPVSDGAMILFSKAEKGIQIIAKLDADGRYRVGMAEGFGLPPDSYAVAILTPMLQVSAAMHEKHKHGGPPPALAAFPKIPVRYRKLETSELRLDLTPAGATFDVDMTPE